MTDSVATEPLPHEPVVAQVQQWVEQIVVGLNLCPFARPVLNEQSLRYVVSDATDWNDLRRFVLEEMSLLWETPPSEVSTSLLIFSHSLQDFEDYLDFLEMADELLEEAGLEGVFQFASFHPNYRFEGEPPDSRSHFTNRAPYPILHLLREDSITKAVEGPLDTEQIPVRNIERLASLTDEEWSNLFGALAKPTPDSGSSP